MVFPDDPFIRELIPEFVDSWLEELNNNFPALFAEKQKDDLYRMAHTMKGSCYQFGLNELGDVGVQLMNYVKHEEWEKVENQCNLVRDKFVEIKEYLSNNSIV